MPKGSCLCGTVQYETAKPLEHVHHCHCSMCRRAHGAAFATYGIADRNDFLVVEGEAHLKAFQSSEDAKRSFCDQCGSSLLYEHAAMPDVVFLAIGTLDEAPASGPGAHFFTASKASWIQINDDLPQHDELPPGTPGTE